MPTTVDDTRQKNRKDKKVRLQIYVRYKQTILRQLNGILYVDGTVLVQTHEEK